MNKLPPFDNPDSYFPSEEKKKSRSQMYFWICLETNRLWNILKEWISSGISA